MCARRVVALLVAGLAIIAFAIWLSLLRHLERATLTGDLVLPGLEQAVASVTELQLHRLEQHATLLAADGAWRVKERDWPADAGRVRRLLLDLGALNVVEEKTRLPANYPALGVEDVSTPKASGTQVDIRAPGRSWSLIVGKPSGAKSGYVRVVNTPQSLLAAPALSVDADPKSWLERTLIDVPLERVREIEVRLADAPAYSALRAKKEDAHFSVTPLPKGRELNGPGAADSLGAALSGVILDDLAPAAAAPATAHTLVRTFDGLEVTVSGRKDGARALIALSAHAAEPTAAAEADKLNARFKDREFAIADYKYGALFPPLTELLKPLPERKKSAAKAAQPGKPAGATVPLDTP